MDTLLSESQNPGFCSWLNASLVGGCIADEDQQKIWQGERLGWGKMLLSVESRWVCIVIGEIQLFKAGNADTNIGGHQYRFHF